MGAAVTEAWKTDRRKKSIVVLFFLLFFLYGCFVFRDYGIGVDEPVERKSSLITWLHLNPSLRDVVTDTVDFSQLQPLEEYQDRYYGMAVMLPCVAAEHLTGFTMPLSDVYEMRHFYNFLLFFAGSIFFYLLCRELGFGTGFSLLGVLFLVLSPRILADSFYNLKDLIFLSLFIVSLYFGIRFIRNSTVKNMAGLAFSAALCTNVRMIGAYLPALCLLAALLRQTGLNGFGLRKKPVNAVGQSAENSAGRQDVRADSVKQASENGTERQETQAESGSRLPGWVWQTCCCLAAGILCLAFYILFTPITWDHPFGRMWEIIEHFSDYSVWNDYNYYMGQYITREEIPWHYLPVWMGITIPAVTLVPAVCGFCRETAMLAAGIFRGLFKDRAKLTVRASGAEAGKARGFRGTASDTDDGGNRLLIWLLFVLPLFYVIWKKPTLYNGWRHFYFLYPLCCLYALSFVAFCQERISEKKGNIRIYGLRCLWTVTAAGFFSTLLWIGRNHPYDYVYFNEFVREWALPRFDKDYWGVSEKDALNAICARDHREKIKIFLLTDFSLPLLSEEDRSRIERVGTMEEAEYYVHGYHAGALGGLPEGSEGMEPWHQIQVDGYPIRTVYKREAQK